MSKIRVNGWLFTTFATGTFGRGAYDVRSFSKLFSNRYDWGTLAILAIYVDAQMEKVDREDTTIYRVVINQEEQYSIWPAHRDLPSGWTDAGKQGLKAECLSFVREVWTDMRPLSLRRHMNRA